MLSKMPCNTLNGLYEKNEKGNTISFHGYIEILIIIKHGLKMIPFASYTSAKIILRLYRLKTICILDVGGNFESLKLLLLFLLF